MVCCVVFLQVMREPWGSSCFCLPKVQERLGEQSPNAQQSGKISGRSGSEHRHLPRTSLQPREQALPGFRVKTFIIGISVGQIIFTAGTRHDMAGTPRDHRRGEYLFAIAVLRVANDQSVQATSLPFWSFKLSPRT